MLAPQKSPSNEERQELVDKTSRFLTLPQGSSEVCSTVFMRVPIALKPPLPMAMMCSLKYIWLAPFHPCLTSLPQNSSFGITFQSIYSRSFLSGSAFDETQTNTTSESLYILLWKRTFPCEMQKCNSHLTVSQCRHFIIAPSRKFKTRFPTFSKEE